MKDNDYLQYRRMAFNGQENVDTLERLAEHFFSCWVICSRNGKCDEAGGAEYKRVFGEWLKQLINPKTLDFITTHANRPPGGAS